MKSPRSAISGPVLLAGCAGIALAFLAATVIAQQGSGEIEAQALSISDEAAPNIEAVSRARAEVRHLESLVARTLNEGSEHIQDDEIEAARRELDQRLASFHTEDQESDQLLANFYSELHQLDLVAERALTLARSGAGPVGLPRAERALHLLADQASATGASLIRIELARVRASAEEIGRLHRRAALRALELDALCLVATGAIAAALYGWHRRFVLLQDKHAAVLQARADEQEQFAGRVAHDIRGPLGAIALSIGLAERSGVQESVRATAFSRARSSLTRVDRLVEGLLDFARAGAMPTPGATAPVPLLIPGLLDELSAEAARARVTLRGSELPACSVACAPGVLISVLANLISNAIKYIGDGERREVRLRVLAGAGRVRFEVEDTGPGVPAALEASIFQAWVRGANTSQPGIGLGLATVKRLVEAHGGAVGVLPAPAGGAQFWVELPRAADPEAQSPEAHAAGGLQQGR